MPSDRYSAETRKRIMDAAYKAFSESGYHGTTIRQIVSLARTNVASVNYHFGGKDALYKEVVETSFDWISRDFDLALENISDDNLYVHLRGFVKQRILEGMQEKPSLPPRLIGWEIVSPKLDIKELMDARIAATEEQLVILLSPLFGVQATTAQKTYAARWFFTFTTPPPPMIDGFWNMIGPNPAEDVMDQAISQMADAAMAFVKILTGASATDQV
jgi:AcrR family transcriptional regulator